MEPLQVASSNSKCSLAADDDVDKHPSSLPATSETPETLITAGSSKLKQARILFPHAAGLPHPTTTTTAMSQRGDEMSSEASVSVETLTMAEDQHQADVMVKENPVFSATNEEAMDVTGDGSTDPELPLVLSTDMTVGINDSDTTPQLPKPRESCAKPHKVKLTKTQRDALRAERERARIEAKAKREAEKQLKEQEKKERREKREQEIQERRERREQEEREKREKREAEQRKKEDERKKKEEEKKKKEDGKRRAEIEAKEGELRKKEQAKERFLGFFSKLPKVNTSMKEDEKPEFALFTPFSVKPGMTLAKPPRPSLGDTGNVDTLLQLQDPNSATYLEEWRARKLVKNSIESEAIVVSDAEDEHDVMIVSSPPVSQVATGRFKLIQFHTNYRPAYYGTWRRKSKVITSRNPFRKDEHLLDYEVDSDDEWEEEEPGESLSHSENEEDSGEDSEEDDGFFVPHGYLSEGEGEHSDGEVATATDNGDECRKQKQLAKAKAWEAEFARKCHPLKPVQVWRMAGHDSAAKDAEFLQQFAAMALVELPISIRSSGETTTDKSHDNQANDTAMESTKRPVPEEAMPELIRLVHGSAMGVGRLIKTFRVHWGRKVLTSSSEPSSSNLSEPILETPNSHQKDTTKYENASRISKRQLEIKIQSIAIKESRPPHSKPVWCVHDSVLQRYGIDPQEITPLVSPPSQTTCDRPKMMSPETPCSNGVKRGIKRKTDSTPSVKTLFETFAKSPANCKAPKETKTALEAASKHTPAQVVHPPSTSPPTKKARLNTNESPAPSSEVIVIQSDDSLESSNNVKENMSADNATSIIVTSHPTTLPSSPNKLMKIHLGALQECTNALGSECEEPVEQAIDWQKLLLNRNKVVVSADIH